MILLKAFHQLLNYLLMINLFSVANDINASADQMNKDLKNISIWVYHWKMYCNYDISKQAQEITFSKKNRNVSHPPIYFNKTCAVFFSYQKHFVPPVICASMHSLSVLWFLCETFSKLLKLALWKTLLFQGWILKKSYIQNFIYP